MIKSKVVKISHYICKMECIFDFETNRIKLKINNFVIEKELRIIAINEYTSMASINYQINNSWKITVSWIIYAGYEQFIELSEYKKNHYSHKDPWTTMAKWSYISIPQAGTIQNSNVNRIICNNSKLNEHNINNIHLFVKNCDYGDWNIMNNFNKI